MHNSEDKKSPTHPRKRVQVACNYCRAKRLKCTADQQPCMNCQLYGAKCEYPDVPRKPRALSVTTSKRKFRERIPTPTPAIPDPIQSPIESNVTIEVNNSDSLVTTNNPMLANARSEPNTTHHLENWTTSHGVRSPDLPMSGDGGAPSASDEIERLSTEVDFNQSFDFWNPTILLHDAVFLGGMLDTNCHSQISPLEANELSMDDPNNTAEHLQQQPTTGAAPNLPQHRCNLQPSPPPPPTPLSQNHQAQISPTRHGKISGVQALKQKSSSPSKQSRILPGLFIRKDAVNSNFIGLHSVGATLAFCIRESVENNHSQSKVQTFDFLIDAGPRVDEAGISSSVDISRYELPPMVIASPSLQAYFENVHVFYPIVDKKTVQATWEQFYTQQPSNYSTVDFLTLYLIIAIGAACGDMTSDMTVQWEAISSNLYQQAWDLQNESFARPSISTVQILLLHVIFLMHQGRGGMAWVLCGIAVRIAQAVGLHRRSPCDFDLTDDQIRLRSQLWWVGFGLDASLSISQGRPTAVSNASFDTELLPLNLQLHASPELNTATADVYRWKASLARIQNRLCEILNCHQSLAARLDALAELDETLMSWRDDIPVECRPEQDILVHHDAYHLHALLHLEYFDLLRTLHWAATTAVPANEQAIQCHDNRRIRACETICLSAARSFIRTLNNMADEFGTVKSFAIRLYADCYLAALAVIYRNMLNHPNRISAKADLEFFRAGKTHFERDYRGCNSTLSNLLEGILRLAEQKVFRTDISEV